MVLCNNHNSLAYCVVIKKKTVIFVIGSQEAYFIFNDNGGAKLTFEDMQSGINYFFYISYI